MNAKGKDMSLAGGGVSVWNGIRLSDRHRHRQPGFRHRLGRSIWSVVCAGVCSKREVNVARLNCDSARLFLSYPSLL